MFHNVNLRLGGMHLLLGYVGSVGTLMHGTGLTEIMESAFSGVSKMLSGKKFPPNVRALRIVATEILRPVFERQEVVDMNSLLTILSDLSKQSRVSKCWIANLIKPVLVMMKYRVRQ